MGNPAQRVALIDSYFGKKVYSVIFLRSTFLVIGEQNYFYMDQMFNHLRVKNRKPKSAKKLHKLVESKNTFIGVNDNSYSLVYTTGKSVKGSPL